MARREALAVQLEDLLERDGGARGVWPDGRSVLLSRNVSGEAPYRVTYFDAEGQPTGHAEYSSIGRGAATAAVGEFMPKGVRIEPVARVESRRQAYNPAQGTLDFERIYDDAQTRPGTTPEQKELGIQALRALGLSNRRAGASVLGSALWKDFQEHKGVELVGQRVENPKDLALLAQILRDTRFETLRYFLVKGSEIVGYSGVTSRLPGMVGFQGMRQMQDFMEDVRSQMARSGADGYWMLHNHPSGFATPSGADQAITRTWAQALPGFKGHVVIDQDQFGFIDAEGEPQVFPMVSPLKPQPEKPHDALGLTISQSSHLVALAKSLKQRAGFDVVATLGFDGRVKGLVEVPERAMRDRLRAMARLRRIIHTMGGNYTFAISDKPRDLDFLVFNGVLTDVVGYSEERSATDRGVGVRPGLRERKFMTLRAEQEFRIRPTGFPVGGYYVVDPKTNKPERFGAPDGDMPKRFATVEAAQKAAEKLNQRRRKRAHELAVARRKDRAAEYGENKIPFVDSPLDEEGKAIERRFRDWIWKHREEALALYRQKNGHIINTDEARELSVGYRRDRSRSAAVHEPSSWLMKELYKRMLAEPVPAGKMKTVVFTGGGTGAGKSTAIKEQAAIQDMVDKAHIVYDTNLNTQKSATQKFAQAHGARHDVHVVGVLRDPIDALANGMLPRAMRMGRTVPLADHIGTHIGFREVWNNMVSHPLPGVELHLLDNTHGKGKSLLKEVATVEPLEYNRVDAEARQTVEDELEAGRISEQVYRGVLGRHEGAQADARRGSSEQGIREEVRRGGEGSAEQERNGPRSGESGSPGEQRVLPGRGRGAPEEAGVTDTAAFKRWFGDSKVVDAQSKPLVVYHGSRRRFTEFNGKALQSTDSGYLGAGFYFGERWHAGMYAGMSAQAARDSAMDAEWQGEAFIPIGEKAALYPVYISLQSPLMLNERRDPEHPHRTLDREKHVRQALGLPAGASAQEVTDAARAAGHDGVIFTYERQPAGGPWPLSREYVAFDPAQIKSAIGNRGSFDPESPSIVEQSPAPYVLPGLAKPAQPTSRHSWNVDQPGKMDAFIRLLQDKHVDTKRVVQAIKNSTRALKDSLDTYLQEELFHGRASKRVHDFLDHELKPLLAAMRDRAVEMPELERYLHARHAEERNVQIAKVNPDMPDGGSGMKTADARKYLTGLAPGRRQTLEALAQKVYAVNERSLQLLVSYGLESQQTVDAWKAAYKFYVPLHREDMDSGLGIGQGFSVKGDTKRALGSRLKVVDILANIAMQRERTIVRGEKNRVATSLVALAKANPNPDFWKIDKPAKIRFIDERTGKVAERDDPMFKSRDNVVVARIPNPMGEVVERAVVFDEHDERAVRMVEALKNLDAQQLGELMSWGNKITRYLASINTQYNPIFGVVNLVRDTQGAILNLSTTPIAGKQAAVMRHLPSALKGIYLDERARRAGKTPSSNWAQLWNEFQREGGQTGYRDMFRTSADRGKAIVREIKRPDRWLVRQAGMAMLDWLSDYNQAMENAVRLSAYKVAVEQGISKQRAASMAKNLTVNFNRRGSLGTQINSLYAFFNASVQGTARLVETLKGPAGKKIVSGGLLLGAMQAFALAAAGFDDDEPPDFIRERNLIIPIGGKKYITIPMPLGLHILPNLSRIPTEWALDGFREPGKRMAELLSVFIDAFNPVGGSAPLMQVLMPSVLDPIAALAENKDWTGKSIYREDFSSLSPTPGHTKARDSTTEAGIWVSKAINWVFGGTSYTPGVFSPTPEAIEYLIGQATGGVGREALKTGETAAAIAKGEFMDLPTYRMPLVGRFFGSSEGKAAESSKFYDNVRELNLHEAEIKGRRKAGEPVAEYLKANPEAHLVAQANASYRAVTKLRKQRRALEDKDAPRGDIDALDRRITAIMKQLNERVRAAEKRGD